MTPPLLHHQVRVLYYPSYDRSELPPLPPPRNADGSAYEVALNVTKAAALVAAALRLHAAGFDVPVPEGANANVFDRAYEELGRRTRGLSHRARTGDDKLPIRYDPRCHSVNSVSAMLWGVLAWACPWRPWVRELIRDMNL